MSNPYQSPSGYEPAPVKYAPYKISRMHVDYSEAINFAFSNPNYFVNLLLMGLVNCIPFVGAMVVYGYLYDDYEKQLKEGRPAPSEFRLIDKFMDYLQRGVMPFVSVLLVGIGAYILSLLVMIPFFVVSIVLRKQSEDLASLLMILGQICSTLMNIALNFVVMPLVFRVGLTGRFEELANYRWALAMVKVMWAPMLIAAILSGLIAGLAGLLGFLLCCVGIIPASAFIHYFYFQIQRQLYEVYVTRGGEQIPLPGEFVGK